MTDQTGVLGANGYGTNINAGGAILLETVLTFLFVLVVGKRSADLSGFAGLAIGLALGVANLLGVGLTGAAVNPARAFGPAIFEGGNALGQLWVFIVFPLLGGRQYVEGSSEHRPLTASKLTRTRQNRGSSPDPDKNCWRGPFGRRRACCGMNGRWRRSLA
ncbi:MIP/aquaporin family protein [Micromonospora sp. LOL_024]|uniref:MIP/aquaporin family protein n=1 Tax=Micromonospora sp. LOL_024 TaxID=3345412 RepID=UPI003A8A1E01